MQEPIFLVYHQHARLGGDGLTHLEGVARGGGALTELLLGLPAPDGGDSYQVTRYDLNEQGIAKNGTVVNG